MADSITLPAIFGVVGAGCAIAALTGGGFKLIVDLPTLDRSKQLGAGALSVIFLALAVWTYSPDKTDTQFLPPTTTPSPTTSLPPPPSSTLPSSKVLVVKYIDNTGYIDIDGQKTWGGDENEPSNEVDISVNPERVASEGVAKIALSESGGKDVCRAAVENEAPADISMGQVQDDDGFCAESRGGRIAYIRFKNLVPKDNDHFFQFELTVYP